MAGSASPKPYDKSSFDNLVFSNLSSPRFDISDFLKTPTDGSPKHEDDENVLYPSFQGFTLPIAPFVGSTSTITTSITVADPGSHHHHPHELAPATTDVINDPSGAIACVEPEIGNPILFEECKGTEFSMEHVLSHADLIQFDDYIDGVLDGRDPFSIFNDANYADSRTGSASSSATGYPSYACAENGIPMSSLSGHPNNLYMPPESCMSSDAGSFVDPGDHVLVGFDHGASTSGPPDGFLYPSSQIDWNMTNQTVPFPTSMGQQSVLQCESCQLLRRIIHSNGVQDTKLEIHGRHGQSYHAVLQTRFCIDDGFPSTLEQQMVDFPMGNSEYVKQFLLQYSMLRSKEGFILRHDSLQVPMDLSCIALERVMDGVNTQMFNQSGQSKLNQSSCSTNPGDGSALPVKPPKSNAAAQRERTGKLKMSDLAQFFHLPINAAAKELGICPTVLKKICRRNGMRRWPHRKIKSIERIIATLEQTIAEGAGQGDESIRMEIAMLRNERAQLCAGLLGEK